MVHADAEASRQVTVARRRLERLTVEPGEPWRPGQTVRIYAYVTEDGRGVAGVRVDFHIYKPGAYTYYIGSATTVGGMYPGWAVLEWTVPWKLVHDGRVIDVLPCQTVTILALCGTGAEERATVQGRVIRPTRLSIFAPDSVPAGQEFNVSGTLEYQEDEGVWRGLAGKTVEVYADGQLLARAVTDSNGRYLAAVKIGAPGRYTLRARFSETGQQLALSVGAAALGVWLPLIPLIPYIAALIIKGGERWFTGMPRR